MNRRQEFGLIFWTLDESIDKFEQKKKPIVRSVRSAQQPNNLMNSNRVHNSAKHCEQPFISTIYDETCILLIHKVIHISIELKGELHKRESATKDEFWRISCLIFYVFSINWKKYEK